MQVNLAEWIRGTVVVGPADEPMLRRAELLEELAVIELHSKNGWIGPGKTIDRMLNRKREILAELAREA